MYRVFDGLEGSETHFCWVYPWFGLVWKWAFRGFAGCLMVLAAFFWSRSCFSWFFHGLRVGFAGCLMVLASFSMVWESFSIVFFMV